MQYMNWNNSLIRLVSLMKNKEDALASHILQKTMTETNV